MIQWQYKLVTDTPDSLAQTLSKLGLKGWEACGFAPNPAMGTTFSVQVLLKRPIEPNPKNSTPDE